MHALCSYCAKRKLNNLDRLPKNTEIPNFMKIRTMGAELLHAKGRTNGRTDERTDKHAKANSRFSQFCERA